MSAANNNFRGRHIGWPASIAVLAIVFAAGMSPQSWAQTNPQPAPAPAPARAPSPTPAPTASKEQESAHQKVQAKASAVTVIEKAYHTRQYEGCFNNEDYIKHRKLADAVNDLNDAIKAEADLSPEVRSASAAATSAVDAVNRVMDDPNHSANDENTARDNYKKASTAKRSAIDKETERIKKKLAEEGFAFESEECKPHTTPPPKPPKPPEPPKKESEKPKETPKETPKAAGEDEERQQIGGAPKCSEGGAQPCSTKQPDEPENASHDSGGLDSFLGGVTIGVGVGHDHHGHHHDRDRYDDRDRKHGSDHKKDSDHKDDSDHKQDTDKEKDKDQDQPEN
jgi:hypothetical protein